MRFPLLLMMWCLWAPMSWAATLAHEHVAGPWMVMEDTGDLVVRVQVRGPAEDLDLLHFQIRDENNEALSIGLATAADVSRPHSLPGTVVSMTIPASQVLDQELSLRLQGGVSLPFTAVRPPVPSARVRVAVVGGWNYPNRREMAAAAAQAGGPISAVVMVGDAWEYPLGRGEWEHTIPLIVPTLGRRSGLQADLVGAGPQWPLAISWGRLGMPIVDRLAAAALTINRDLSPVQVPLLLKGPWRLDRMAPPASSDPGVLAPLVEACVNRRLPLVLAGAGPAGFVSDSLRVDARRRVTMGAPGVRYVSVISAGQACVRLPPLVAQALDDRSIVVLDSGHEGGLLRMLVCRESETAMELTYGPLIPRDPLQPTPPPLDMAADGYVDPTPAWGIGNAKALFRDWLGDTYRRVDNTQENVPDNADQPVADTDPERAQEALLRLAWLPWKELADSAPSSVELRELLSVVGSQEGADILLRRLCSVDTIITNEWGAKAGQLTPMVARDIVLRNLHDRAMHADPLIATILGTTEDPELLRSVLEETRQNPSLPLLRSLRVRLRAQARGDLPLEKDIFLQHRLMAAVFDSPYLSPTRLRNLAIDLEDKVDPGARGPIDRFLQRHGRARPVDN